MATARKYWAVIPAAGIGTRMGMEIPKQYLKVQGKSILEHTLQPFCRHPDIQGIVVALAEGDPYWDTLSIASHKKIQTTIGGVERCHSVRNSLKVLKTLAGSNDWVMVHDAARPCLRTEDLDRLIGAVPASPGGVLLAIPVRDTMKRADHAGMVIETVERERLWNALTPQMFRISVLEEAIDRAISRNIMVTDEAQAIELSGMHPLLVEGTPDNIKITHKSDLPLAELFLSRKENQL